MKKYIFSGLRYFLIYLFGFLAFTVLAAAASVLYNCFTEWMPEIFPEYNFITDAELAEKLQINLNFTAGVFALFILEIIAVKYDNSRYEYLISETDGFYTIKEGCSVYLDRYLRTDIIISALIPLTTFWLVFIKIGDDAPKFLKILEKILQKFISLPLSFTEKAGLIGGAVLLVSLSVIARIPAVWLGLRRWRAVWLTDIGREDA